MDNIENLMIYIDVNAYSPEVFPDDILNPKFGWTARLVGSDGVAFKAFGINALKATIKGLAVP